MGALLAWLPSIISGIGTFMQYKGQRQANDAQRDQQASYNLQLKYQSDMALLNSALARKDAAFALQTAKIEAGEVREEGRVFAGQQLAEQGASGLVAGAGTFMNLLADTAKQSEIDARKVERNGRVAAWRSRLQARQSDLQSEMFLKSIDTTPTSNLGAFSTLLGGLGSAFINSPLIKKTT